MSLDGAQLNFVNASGATVAHAAKGRKFNVGSFLGCDLVLPDAERLHCEIQCDAFGRVSRWFVLLRNARVFRFYKFLEVIILNITMNYMDVFPHR